VLIEEAIRHRRSSACPRGHELGGRQRSGALAKQALVQRRSRRTPATTLLATAYPHVIARLWSAAALPERSAPRGSETQDE
jgi:hypothetical protein